MRILSPPRRTTITGATFARNSEAIDSLGRIALPGLPRLEYVDGVGWITWVEEADTNLLTENQASVETDTTGFYTVSSAVLSRDTTIFKYGNASLKTVTPGAVANEGFYTSFASVVASNTYTASVWFKGSGTVLLGISEYTAASVYVGLTYASTITLTDTWTRYSVSRAFGSTGERALIRIITTSGTAQNITFYADGLQLSQKAYPTSFCMPDSSRAAESLTMPVLATNLLTANQASVEEGTTGFYVWNDANATITRDTTEYKYGAASLKIVTLGQVITEGVAISPISILPNSIYTLSIWLKGSGAVTLYLIEIASGGGFVGQTMSSVTLTSVWTRYSLTRTTVSNGGELYLLVATNAAQAITFWADGLQLELGPYATTWNIPTGATPRMGLPVDQGTIEGIVEITDVSKRQDGIDDRLFKIVGSSGYILLTHLGSSAYWSLYVSNGTNTANINIADSLTPSGWYYFKVSWSTTVLVEFWDLETQTEVASNIISSPYLPAAFDSYVYLGNNDTGSYFADTRFGKHRLSNIVRTTDPDFDNLMPNDANTG